MKDSVFLANEYTVPRSLSQAHGEENVLAVQIDLNDVDFTTLSEVGAKLHDYITISSILVTIAE